MDGMPPYQVLSAQSVPRAISVKSREPASQKYVQGAHMQSKARLSAKRVPQAAIVFQEWLHLPFVQRDHSARKEPKNANHATQVTIVPKAQSSLRSVQSAQQVLQDQQAASE